jgi:predicted dehydrogenase
VLFAQVHCGSYLPEWRPGRDYRESYSAKSSLGGGCLLDIIHEIDLACWYQGEVRDVLCRATRLSRLEIDVEDYALLVLGHASGAITEVHLDYLQRTYERGCRIVGENGTIFWDFRDANVKWYRAETGEWSYFAQPDQWQINQMYLDELEHFLACCLKREPSTLPIAEAYQVLQVVLAAKRSSEEACQVLTREVKK